ncbi:MAG: hypothetical protein C4530_07945 [Desulfobacteraceae bacterium]|nr:MAG: hypothetical protein C4530_07945 [Desulfobacteraceae bacterium]
MISAPNLNIKSLFSLITFFAIAVATGIMAAKFSSTAMISMILGLGFFIVAFIHTELGLYLLVFSMLLSPEFTVGAAGGEVAQRGGVALRLEDFLLLVIGFSWFTRAAINKEIGLFLKTPLNKPIFFYLMICLISTGLGVIGGRVNAKVGFFYVLKYFEYFIIYFMMVNHLEKKKQVNRFLICLFITCFLVSVYGILQIPMGVRVSAPFEGEAGEPNTLGGYLLFIGALAIGLISKIEDTKGKMFAGILIFAIIPPLLFTYSRSTYLSIIPMGLYLSLRTARPAILIGLFLSLLLVSPFLLPKSVIDRLKYTISQAETIGQIQVGEIRLDTSLSARLTSWEQTAIGFIQHPVFGHGVTGFGFVDAQYFRVLVETGAIGVCIFFYLIFAVFKLIAQTSHRLTTPYYKGIVTGFTAGFIGLLFHAIGANTFIIVRIMEPFWLVAAIVFALPKLEEAERMEQGA